MIKPISDTISVQVHDDSSECISLSPSPFLFHQRSFTHRSLTNHPTTFSILNETSEIGRITFSIKKEEANSLTFSPFGGFELYENATAKEVELGLKLIIQKLKAPKITIRLFPKVYDTESHDIQCHVFEKIGFEKIFEDKSQVIPIRKVDFDKIVSESQFRHLKFGRQSENEFKKLDPSRLPTVYDLLKSNRENKGYPITLSYEDLESTIKRFPNQFMIFGFFIGETLAAASVCIKVSDHILYDFYHGHLPSFEKLSPVVPLVEGIYQYAQKNNFKYLDLGISTKDGKMNEGLFEFKRRLGAKVSVKPTFQLTDHGVS